MVRLDRRDGGQRAAFHLIALHMIGIAGYNGRGIGPGTVFGSVLAEHILAEAAADDLPLPVSLLIFTEI